MIWHNALFSFRGRLNRQGFWIGTAVNFAFLLIVVNFLPISTAYGFAHLLPLAISAYSLIAIAVKRLHDRNRSGKAVFIAFVPVVCYGVSLSVQGTMAWLLGVMMPLFIGTILLIEWGFFQGNPQENQYGKSGESIEIR